MIYSRHIKVNLNFFSMEGTKSVKRPVATSAFEEYMMSKVDNIEGRVTSVEKTLDKVVEKQEVHDTKFEAIFFCFDRHEESIDELKTQGKKILARIEELRADNKVTQSYYDVLKARIERMELGRASV